MNGISRTAAISLAIIVVTVAVLALGLVLGWISTDDFTSGAGKTLAVVGIVALAVIAILGLNSTVHKD